MKDNSNKRVTFNTRDDIEQKLDKLTVMMGKLVTEDEGHNKQFKPWVYQSKRGRGQSRGRVRSDNAYRGHSGYNWDFRNRMGYSPNNRGRYGYNMRRNQRYERNNNNNRRGNYRNRSYDRNRSRSYERQNRNRRNSRSVINSRSRSGSRASTNRDRIRSYECGEYNHFARECTTGQANREIEQIQKMFNMDDDQTILQTPLMDTDKGQLTIILMEARDNLNL